MSLQEDDVHAAPRPSQLLSDNLTTTQHQNRFRSEQRHYEQNWMYRAQWTCRSRHSLRCRVECGVAVDVAVNARCTNQEARRRTRRACRAMAHEWQSTGAGRGIACAAPLADTSPTRTLRPGRRPRPAPLGSPSSACSAASSRPPSARARAPRGWRFRAPGSQAGRLFLWGRRRRRPRARPQEPGRHI